MIVFTLEKKILNARIYIALVFLILYTFWGFVFERTIYESQNMRFLCFILMFILFFNASATALKSRLNFFVEYWVPYIIYTIFGYFIFTTFQYVFFWISVLLMLICSNSMINSVPVKLFLWSGLFGLSGVFFQLLLPTLYVTYVVPFFPGSLLISWMDDSHGLAGFTYQLDQTAIIILFLLFYLLYCFRVDTIRRRQIRFILIVLAYVGILLAGKRSILMIGVFIPLLVKIFMQSKTAHLLLVILLVSCLGYVFSSLFQTYAEDLSQMDFVGRYVNSFLEWQSGADVSSGRSDLYLKAWNAFCDNIIFGCGAGPMN